MNFEEINVEETHIRLTTDVDGHDLSSYIFLIRRDLKNYISRNSDFRISLEPVESEGKLPLIAEMMIKASDISQVGPMACVAGTISEMSLNYLIDRKSSYSIVENGGDIALVNDRKVLCGIYSNNEVLGNSIAFEIKSRKNPLGICTSSGKIGHSISFGDSDSVTVISPHPSIADGLATRIANEVRGINSEDKVNNALEVSEEFKEFFDGVLIISQDSIGTVGKLPNIVETGEFGKTV